MNLTAYQGVVGITNNGDDVYYMYESRSTLNEV